MVVENYFDDDARQNLIFDCVFGRRVNDALARSLGNAISERRHGILQTTVSDNGFMITLPSGVYINPELALDLFPKSSELRDSLARAIRRSEMVKRRFRHCAGRSLMVLRNYKGEEESSWKTAGQFPDSDVNMRKTGQISSARRGIQRSHGGLDGRQRRNQSGQGDSKKESAHFAICRRETIPSPFSHNLVLRGSTDIVSLSDRKETLQSLYDNVMKKVYASKREPTR